MRRNLQIFFLFSRFALKTILYQPVGAIFFLIGKLLRFGMYFFFVFYLISNTKILAGYSFNQTLIFFLTFNVIDTAAQLFFREVYRFRPLVVSGELDSILIKPYHPFLRILVGGVDLLDFVSIVVYIALLVFFMSKISLFSINIFFFILLILNGLLIATAFHIMVLALGILTTEVDHTIMIYRDLTRIGTFPIDIYQEPLRSIFTFILPIGIMMTFPVKSLFGFLSLQTITASFAVGGILILFALFLWDRALKKYQSWGG